MSERHLKIYTRAHTEIVRDKSKNAKKARDPKPVPERLPKRVLTLDVETRTDVHQRFMFGIYRICKLVDGQYLSEREGIFYSGEPEEGPQGYSARLDEKELNAIGKFVAETQPDVEKEYPPKFKFEVHRTYTEFMEKVFWPAVRRGDAICGFNLPFDLSRISRGWRPTRSKRGFGLIMTWKWSKRKQRWVSGKDRPRIRIESKDARTAFITFGSTKNPEKWPRPKRAIDLSTLLFSMFDEHKTLNAWGREFQKPEFRDRGYEVDLKMDHSPSGRVTADELAYCHNDVKITHQYLNVAVAEFLRHPLPQLLPDKSYSPASIGKAYYEAMGIIPPSEKFKLSKEELAIAMQAYYGGRAEVHIRRRRVPVMRLDFL